MKKRLIATLETLSRLIPLGVYPRIIPREVIDFFWHAVSDETMPHVRHLYPVVPSRDFEAALLYLKGNYNFINYQQLHAYYFEGAKLPPNSVHISFDDGYAECYSVVRPLLIEHGIPCTFFLTTDLIDNPILFYRNKQSLVVEQLTEPGFKFQNSMLKHLTGSGQQIADDLPEYISWFKDLRLPDEALINEICNALDVDWKAFLEEHQPYLTSEQIQQMHADGFTMGAHTLSHRKLVDLPQDEIEAEISESCRIVGEITGQETVPFSFPHSAWGLDRDHLAGIRKRHPEIGLLFDTKGLRRDVSFIHNRVWAERPVSGYQQTRAGADRMRDHLRLAFQEVWIDEMMARGRGLRRK